MPGDEKEEVEDITNPDVVTKYRTAGDIVNKALAFVAEQCKDGAKIVDICEAGDKFILEQTATIFKGKKIEKGIGFPTCVSVNNVVGHFSPLKDDDRALAKGDVAKIDLGVHIDGYIAVSAHTVVVEGEQEITGRTADVVLAAHYAAEAAIRMVKPGVKNQDLTEMFTKVADEFKVSVVGGVLSHEMSRFVIDGEKVIISKTEPDQKVDDFEFEPNQVFAMDIVMSTGDGKCKEVDERTTVYKRAVDTTYQLKMKYSRALLSEINKNHPTFPFTIRDMDESKTRIGIKECKDHELVHAYPVLWEKQGETLAHFKFTCLLMPTGTIKITGLSTDINQFKSEHSIKDEELLKVLAQGVGKKKKKKNKKKKDKKDDDKDE